MQINGTGPIVSDPSSQVPPPPAASAISADFSTFLTLLTTQLRSQDPLNPVDSTDFVAQLASFSTVEQQTRTNQLLEQLVSGSGPDSRISNLASWIGREVGAPGSAEWNGSTPVEYFAKPPEGADAAVMTVRNDFGSPVARLLVDPEGREITWDGTIANGEAAPAGSYTAHLVYSAEEAPIASQDALVYSAVREGRVDDGRAVLLLKNGTRIALDDVAMVRDANSRP